MSTGGYFCPKCKVKFCELPTECRVCGLTLVRLAAAASGGGGGIPTVSPPPPDRRPCPQVSASHLARSYHHLFPVPLFEELEDFR
jgi:transcription initiation factor TFIIH subunit 2